MTDLVHPGVAELPPYVFDWLEAEKATARRPRPDLIDLGMGTPDRPTPRPIVQALAEAAANPVNHRYPPFRGTERLRGAVASYMKRRFGVDVDPAHEVLALSGAKEGIAHMSLATARRGTVTLLPDIHYPVHARATWRAGGRTHYLPLTRNTGFVPDLDAIPADVLREARLLILNYPHNPTGAVAPFALYEQAVALCREHDILLISDLAYAEMGGASPPPSALEVPGAMETTVEFHSFSKTFNMSGARLGFAVGGGDAIQRLVGFRTDMGYGTPPILQEAGAFALDHLEELVPDVIAVYAARRRALLADLATLGWAPPPGEGSMFVWLPVPPGHTSREWTSALMHEAGVVVTPGDAFGPGGEGFFRMSLIVEEPVLAEAVSRMRAGGFAAATDER